MNLLPLLQPQMDAQEEAILPLYREVAWDREENRPRFRGGNPAIVTGKDAVLSWAYRALQVPRFRYEIYTAAYGNQCQDLIGSAYTEELKQAEAIRYLRECLLCNPYILGVEDISVSFAGGKLAIRCTVNTIYGEGELYG